MQKLVICGVLSALVLFFTPAIRAQGVDEVEMLRKENALLKKENELLKKGVASKFQLTFEDVDKDITEFDDVELGETNFGREVKFYNIKIEAK